jgi:hypothetical protein
LFVGLHNVKARVGIRVDYILWHPIFCAFRSINLGLSLNLRYQSAVLFATAIPLSRKQETRSEEVRERKVGYMLEKKRQKDPIA